MAFQLVPNFLNSKLGARKLPPYLLSAELHFVLSPTFKGDADTHTSSTPITAVITKAAIHVIKVEVLSFVDGEARLDFCL
jgi:hypothetical protein